MLSNAFKLRNMAAAVLLASVSLSAAVPVRAADLDVYAAPATVAVGVDCASPEAQSFSSVWLGHFAGGNSEYTGPGGRILLDWHDDKLCFPTKRSCDRWVYGMRREFHHPEGNFTCLTIR
jgi:hypothetical protein